MKEKSRNENKQPKQMTRALHLRAAIDSEQWKVPVQIQQPKVGNRKLDLAPERRPSAHQ